MTSSIINYANKQKNNKYIHKMNKYGRKRTLKVIVFGTFHFDNLSGFEIFNFVEVLPLF